MRCPGTAPAPCVLQPVRGKASPAAPMTLGQLSRLPQARQRRHLSLIHAATWQRREAGSALLLSYPQSQLTCMRTISPALVCCPGKLHACGERWGHLSQVCVCLGLGGASPATNPVETIHPRTSEGWDWLNAALRLCGFCDPLC